jgi:hypothetical protein
MGFENNIDAVKPNLMDRFNAAVAGFGSGDTSISEILEENKLKNVALFATHMQPPAQNNGSAFGWGYAASSNDTGASNI